jgi:cobalt-zinc-cadmium resistance protein CzcA
MRFHELISGVRGDLAVKVFGENPVELRRAAEEIAAVMRGVPGAADVKVEQTTGMPELTVRPKLGTMARYGLDAAEVVESVNIAIGGRAAGQVFDGDRRFDIVVRLPEAKRRQASTLVELPILLPVDPSGDAAVPPILPLSELAEVVQTEGPFQVSRENSKRRVVAQCNVRDRDLAGFVGEVRERVNSDVKLPAGTWLDWGGQFENLTAARQRLAIVVPACFALIFLLLHATFGAVRPALLVFTAVPLALTGGVAALWLRGLPFSISAAVGFIALSGVAVLNGLVLVTFINQLREQGRPLEEAVREGALTRLRPVLMTALVASLGFLPMALATGTGAEVQRPLATVVIGGILTATALTLVVLPALCQRVLRKDL